MALKTEDDYQDEIDDLMKEIDRLYDEGTDKGFKLKREEEMDQELRALVTQEDFQDVYDDDKKEFLKAKKKKDEAIIKLNTAKEDVKKWDKEFDFWADQEAMYAGYMEKTYQKAQKKGFKLKRSEETSLEERKNSILANLTDLEARKSEVLAGLELRALDTEKDFQKAYDKIIAQWKEQVDLEEKLRNSMRVKIAKLQNELDDQVAEAKNKAAKLFKEGQQLWFDAKKKGFDLKVRSADVDFETRALDTLEDYQKEYDRLANDFEKNFKKYSHIKMTKEELEDQIKILDKYQGAAISIGNRVSDLVREAKKKGFKIKEHGEVSKWY